MTTSTRYQWNKKSLYAIDIRTGDELVYGEYEDITIREATAEDIKRRIFKTEGMKAIIKMMMKRKGISRKDAEAMVELKLRRAFECREKDSFGIEYVVEANGKFVAYAEITTYGDEPSLGETERVRKIFVGGQSYENEITYAGVDFFFVDMKTQAEYLPKVCLAFGHLCDEYGFFDHLDLVKVNVAEDPKTKEMIRKINVFGTLYDYAT